MFTRSLQSHELENSNIFTSACKYCLHASGSVIDATSKLKSDPERVGGSGEQGLDRGEIHAGGEERWLQNARRNEESVEALIVVGVHFVRRNNP
jgi:hypothetical protein